MRAETKVRRKRPHAGAADETVCPTSTLTARLGASERPLAHARGSDRSHDRQGVVLQKDAKSRGHGTSVKTRLAVCMLLLLVAATPAMADTRLIVRAEGGLQV